MLPPNFVCPRCGEWFSVEYVRPHGEPGQLDEHEWRITLTHNLLDVRDQVARLPLCPIDNSTVIVPWRIAVDEPMEPA